MLEKYDGGASKDVYNIVIGDESWICAYESKTKQHSTVWVFQPEPNASKVVYVKITSKQMVYCFFSKTYYVALEHRMTVISECYTTICLPKVLGEIRTTNKRNRIIKHRLKSAPY